MARHRRRASVLGAMAPRCLAVAASAWAFGLVEASGGGAAIGDGSGGEARVGGGAAQVAEASDGTAKSKRDRFKEFAKDLKKKVSWLDDKTLEELKDKLKGYPDNIKTEIQKQIKKTKAEALKDLATQCKQDLVVALTFPIKGDSEQQTKTIKLLKETCTETTNCFWNPLIKGYWNPLVKAKEGRGIVPAMMIMKNREVGEETDKANTIKSEICAVLAKKAPDPKIEAKDVKITAQGFNKGDWLENCISFRLLFNKPGSKEDHDIEELLTDAATAEGDVKGDVKADGGVQADVKGDGDGLDPKKQDPKTGSEETNKESKDEDGNEETKPEAPTVKPDGEEQTKEGKDWTLIIIIIVSALVLLVALGFTAFYLLNRSRGEEDQAAGIAAEYDALTHEIHAEAAKNQVPSGGVELELPRHSESSLSCGNNTPNQGASVISEGSFNRAMAGADGNFVEYKY